jgi:hypothetical protein
MKDDMWHLAIDYRALYKIAVKKWYHFPIINDLLDQLWGTQFFSKIDLKIVYHHVQIYLEDLWNIVFKSQEEVFEWLVMYFFTKYATTFMWLMNGEI